MAESFDRWPEILERLGRGAPLQLTSLSGGLLTESAQVAFEDGSQVYIKYARSDAENFPLDMFRREAEGLEALALTRTVRIPRVVAVEPTALVLEFVHEAPKPRGFFRAFGRAVASLHAHHGKTSGYPSDNYIGTTLQNNEPMAGPWDDAPNDGGSTWPAFFLERRLRFQMRLAQSRQCAHDLPQLLDAAESRILELIGGAIEQPSLLHGDLWSGNFIADEHGKACLFDAAVYYGHREADLAMTHLFGGFNASFYDEYNAAFPLAPGHEARLPIYKLYHLLNHLNLFGSGYYQQCKNILLNLI